MSNNAHKENRWTIIWLILCLGGMILFFGPTDNWTWDPSYYYAQLRSPIIENDLDFRSELVTNGVVPKVTATGLQGSLWPVGPSILWSPFFLAAHLIVLLTSPAQATGFSFLYIAMVSFGSVFYGMTGLWVLYKICRHFAGRYISIASVLFCLAATPLFYYLFRQPVMAHTTSLLVSATLFWFYTQLIGKNFLREYSGLVFGVLLGLSFLTRWSGILFVFLPLTYFTNQMIKVVRGKNFSQLSFLIQQMVVMLFSFGLTILPQLTLWYRLYGSILVTPQSANSFVADALPINILKLIFNTNRGVIFWSPFILVGMLGIFRIPNREIRTGALLCAIFQVILIGYRVDWFGGGGYGPRYFIELLPIVAVGFVCLLQDVPEKLTGRVLVAVCLAGLITHQFVLLYSFEHASDGWINLQNYLRGQQIGLSWQLINFLRLIENPRLWFAPLYVAQDRQTILVNYAAGIRNFDAYLITGTAAVATLIAGSAFTLIRKWITGSRLVYILLGTGVYLEVWAVYFLMVG